MPKKIYACIDLKSFYASVECAERGLDPFTSNLVVADPSRGSGAITLAITPAMKALGVPNRCRIFQIPKHIEYITAMPRMKHYMKYSADIYSIYLKYISKDDIHVYSIDECFFDLTPYLSAYDATPKELVQRLMDDVLARTGISASAGIGTNLFLAKVALDITAKHAPDRIGSLDEESFRAQLWHHRPITDIWNIGKGIAGRLEKYGIYDLHGVAHYDEKVLYREFGVNAEFLIDHAHGIEPCTIQEIQDFKAESSSITNGQVLFEDYSFDDAWLVVREMLDLLVLELIEKQAVTDSIALHIGYTKNVQKSTGGTRRLGFRTNSYKKLVQQFERLYHETTRPDVPIHRINIGLQNVTEEDMIQLDLFSDAKVDAQEQKIQEVVLSIKNKFGKNAILRGMSLQDKATAQKRNRLTGGHNSE